MLNQHNLPSRESLMTLTPDQVLNLYSAFGSLRDVEMSQADRQRCDQWFNSVFMPAMRDKWPSS